jgi:hypothetical protein
VPSACLGVKPTPVATELAWLVSGHNWHWCNKDDAVPCHLCSVHKEVSQTVFICSECDYGLCF